MSANPGIPLLIVDDDAPIRKLLERVALRAGFEVTLARDGLEALELLEQKQFAIAIIDLMMPRLSGYDLVQRMSTMSPRPVIIVATAMTNADVSKIDDTLVRRVIRKPFDVAAVAEALIETAKQVAEQKPIVPESSIIHLSAEELTKQIEAEKKEKEKKEKEKEEKQPESDA